MAAGVCPLPSLDERRTCVFEPAAGTGRDQEGATCDLWALAPAAGISGSGVQLRSEEVRGGGYNEGQRRRRVGTAGKGRGPGRALRGRKPVTIPASPVTERTFPALPLIFFLFIALPHRSSAPMRLTPG